MLVFLSIIQLLMTPQTRTTHQESLQNYHEIRQQSVESVEAVYQHHVNIKADFLHHKIEQLASDPLVANGYHQDKQTFELTAYTFAAEENGHYGSMSAAQYDISDKYLDDRYIAVDPTVIPYHSTVYIEFAPDRRYVEFHGQTFDLNGEYLAVDCGGAIKQNRIDLYIGGDGVYYDQLASHIGRQDVTVYFKD